MNKAYKLLQEEKIDNLDSVGQYFLHTKSGARICFLSNSDENKVFYIGFRTPPKDSTGVAHIVEHTVLCGSAKYPVKDPFVELVKGSLNTFLNAFTYPDKTVYPVASMNKVDFYNLVDVYMDSVFFPNIYKYREIFQQEGWHYELNSLEEPITINGVVYNEMRGAFSNPEEVLAREILNSLFPDTTYAIESGGDPKEIPNLTYEDYLDFHRRYYHPSNSYIYVYGDVNIDEMLDYLDREYLSKFDFLTVDSSICLQNAFDETKDYVKYYPITSEASEEDCTYLSYNVCIGDVLDLELNQGFDILDYALISAPGAPVYEALIKSGICEDIECGFENSNRQMYFSIVARGANYEDKDKFVDIIESTLRQVVNQGIDRKTLLAAINAENFRARELDFGTLPKGLILGLNILDSWLYDEDLPFLQLHRIEILEELKNKTSARYFEALIERYILNNTHKTLLSLVPKKGLVAIDDEKLSKKLEDYKNSLSKDELLELISNTKHLREYQSTPSSSEELESIPMLSREDLNPKARPFDLKIVDKDVRFLHHDINTNSIHYFKLMFDVNDASIEDFQYLSLLERFLGLFDTKNFSYKDLTDEINLHTGGLSTVLSAYECNTSMSDCKHYFVIRVKFFENEAKNVCEIILEMIKNTDFSNRQRLHELIITEKSKLEMQLQAQGQAVAAGVIRTAYSKKAYISDYTSGLKFYEFLKYLDEHFDEKSEEIISRLNKITKTIFSKNRLLVSTIGNSKICSQAQEMTDIICKSLYEPSSLEGGVVFDTTKIKRAYKSASLVQYVAMGGNYLLAGQQYNPCLKILNQVLSYDYFWNNIRVKGGAYGCNVTCTKTGEILFVSYRDPKLKDTIEVFKNTAKYLKEFDASQRDMTKYIIGTIGMLDTPLSPYLRGQRDITMYMLNNEYATIQKERTSIINATVEDIRKLGDIIDAAISQDNLVVVGSEEIIEDSKELFDTISTIM